MIDHDALDRLVIARGGSTDCLHCVLSTLISAHFETRPEGLEHAIKVAGALAEVIGDLIGPAPSDRTREECVARMVELMRERFTVPAADKTQLN